MRRLMNRFLIPLALAAVLLLVVLASAVGEHSDAPAPPPRPAKPHVVLLIMDEFPGDSLLDRRGRVDPVRYPNFASLAADSTWFRNGHSIFDSTTKAVPLILDGRWPRPGTSPDRRGHPRSVFDMFARNGYRMVASEEGTALCPPRMCQGGRTHKPAVL